MVHLFEKRQHVWVCGDHWGMCLFWVLLFGKHHHPSFGDRHWEEYFWKLQVFAKYHHSWVVEARVWRLWLREHHHFDSKEDNGVSELLEESPATYISGFDNLRKQTLLRIERFCCLFFSNVDNSFLSFCSNHSKGGKWSEQWRADQEQFALKGVKSCQPLVSTYYKLMMRWRLRLRRRGRQRRWWS